MARKIEEYESNLRLVLDDIRQGGSLEFDSIDVLHRLISDDEAAFWNIVDLYGGGTINDRVRTAAGQVTKYLIDKCGVQLVSENTGTKLLRRPPYPDGSEGTAPIDVPGWNLSIMRVRTA